MLCDNNDNSVNNISLWTEYENDTLIHYHKISTMYKKRYQRASDLYNSLHNFFGIITVISSSIASTISWGEGIEDSKKMFLTSVTTTSAISAAIQNFYKFKETSESLTVTAKKYSSLQNKIENLGNIEPSSRPSPFNLFTELQRNFDEISSNRQELSNNLIKCCYYKLGDDHSYLEDKKKMYMERHNLDKYNNSSSSEDSV
tara:strand:- start:910 stop:1512 length:603 start_codon:yes stop_codon:yes gene_type:complete